MKKLLAVTLSLCLMLSCLTMAATALASERGDLIRFVPTKIVVSDNQVRVEGYFINMNTDASVKNFEDFNMSVYLKDEELIEGDFGKINEFTIPPLGMKYQTFTFNGSHNLNNGDYTCTPSFYCLLDCTFTSVLK